jgi:E3 ubiquitin-protein ligase makorin
MTPYDLNKTCKFYVAGFCSKGDTCWFKHTVPVHEVGVEAVGASGTSSDAPVPAQEVAVREVEPCSICYEDPVTFGLLSTSCIYDTIIVFPTTD